MKRTRKLVGSGLDQRSACRSAGIVDQDMHRWVVGQIAVNGSFDGSGLAEVGDNIAMGLAFASIQLRQCLPEAFFVAGHQSYVSAQQGQLDGCCFADALCTTAHQGRLSG